MPFTVQDLIHGKRQVSLDYHAAAGRAWLLYGREKQLPSPLIYAAVEFRMAMERFVLELLVCLEDQLKPSDVEQKSAKQIVQTLLDYASDPSLEKSKRKARLLKALQFNRLVSEHILDSNPELGRPLYTPDLDDVLGFWKRLSDYCHAKTLDVFDDADERFVKEGYGLLEEVLGYLNVALRDHHFGGMPVESMPPETQHLRNRYIDGDIDDSGVRKSLELMGPILEQRQKNSER